jgi:hypothetical protein
VVVCVACVCRVRVCVGGAHDLRAMRHGSDGTGVGSFLGDSSAQKQDVGASTHTSTQVYTHSHTQRTSFSAFSDSTQPQVHSTQKRLRPLVSSPVMGHVNRPCRGGGWGGERGRKCACAWGWGGGG